MSKKKGLSFEEKRDRMLEVFYVNKDVYQLKDLERICPKVKLYSMSMGMATCLWFVGVVGASSSNSRNPVDLLHYYF